MHSLRPFAILLAILTIPAVLGWGLLTVFLPVLLFPRGGQPGTDLLLAGAAVCGVLLMGWVSLASLFWTARHFNAYISPTPRWVLAGYLFGALVLAVMLPGMPTTLSNLLSLNSSLAYIAGPAGLLFLALWRLWHIHRFYR